MSKTRKMATLKTVWSMGVSAISGIVIFRIALALGYQPVQWHATVIGIMAIIMLALGVFGFVLHLVGFDSEAK